MSPINPLAGFICDVNTSNWSSIVEIARKVSFEPYLINNITDLFGKLSNTSFNPRVLVFDTDVLYQHANMDAFDIINTVEILSKSKNTASPCLAVIIYKSTPVDQIRDILKTNVKGYLYDAATAPDRFSEGMQELLAGKSYTDKAVIDLSRPAKKHRTRSSLSTVAGIDLTTRQEQILRLICSRGSSNKQIARILNLSESTIKLHIGAILKKYGLKNRTQLALFTRNHWSKN